MTGRRTIIGLCMLCALAFSAIAAQGASAVTKGTTAFTCVENGGQKDRSDEHCETAVAAGTGKYGHKEIAENLDTTLKITPKGPQVIKTTIGGTAVTMTTSELENTAGTCTNMKDPSGEHFFDCKGVVLMYKNVKVTPVTCTAEGLIAPGGAGTITTNPLTVNTTGKGDEVTLTPEGAADTTFFEFKLTGAGCPLLNQVIKVIGSITMSTKGATLIAEHTPVTTRKELRVGSTVGPIAGYEGVNTISLGEVGKPHNPISLTTVETA